MESERALVLRSSAGQSMSGGTRLRWRVATAQIRPVFEIRSEATQADPSTDIDLPPPPSFCGPASGPISDPRQIGRRRERNSRSFLSDSCVARLHRTVAREGGGRPVRRLSVFRHHGRLSGRCRRHVGVRACTAERTPSRSRHIHVTRAAVAPTSHALASK
jgi:hypothetical protein